MFYLTAAPARIGVAMTGLGIVWLVHGATGSYAAAGTVTGAFAVSEALLGPQAGRLTDRYGQTRMVPAGLVVHAAAIAVLIWLCAAGAPLGLLVAAGALAGGGAALALQRRTAPVPAARQHRHDATRLLRPAFLALVGASIGIGLFFGTMQVSVTAFAVGRDAEELAGPLYSVTSLASLVAGLGYGARRWRMPATTQLVVTCALLTVSCTPLMLVSGPASLAVALALPGVLLAPYLVLVSVIAESRIETGVVTQAFTWLSSGSAAGIAVGAAVSGRVVDGNDPRWGFALAIAATLVVLGCAVLAAVRRSDR